MKLINLGCSFSYGNCVSQYETFADEQMHIGPGTLLAEHLNCEEVNIASPGLSLDGVLRRLYTFPINKDDILLVGLPPEVRFQIVAIKPRDQKKTRGGQGKKRNYDSIFQTASKWRADAFNRGPTIPDDWFHTQSWLDAKFKNYNTSDHIQYHAWFNILLIQKRLEELNCKHWLYNSVYGHMQHSTTIPELQTLKESISTDNYYQPTAGMRDFSDQSQSYQISRDDTHPNHLCYKEWIKGFIEWSVY